MMATMEATKFKKTVWQWGDNTPFLSIVTRCHPERPQMWRTNFDSVMAQTSQEYEQVHLIDTTGQGVTAANRALVDAQPRGEYVLILDDDDMLTDPEAIDALKASATPDDPALIVFRADHGPLGILPRADSWERPPTIGSIGSCDFVVRRDVWERHIKAFAAPRCGDYYFLRAIWDDNPTVVWLDRQLTAVQRISNGAPE